jgi:hypothetical protein
MLTAPLTGETKSILQKIIDASKIADRQLSTPPGVGCIKQVQFNNAGVLELLLILRMMILLKS